MKNILSSTRLADGANFNCYFLPKAMLRLIVKKSKSGGVNVTHELKIVPDAQHRYYLNYNPSALTEDSVKVEFTPEGFLQRIEMVTEDKTGEILEKFAELGGLIAEGLTGLPEFTDRGMEEMITVYDATFDPFNAFEMQQARKEIADGLSDDQGRSEPIDLEIDVRLLENVDTAPEPADPNRVLLGIFCRPTAQAELKLRFKNRIQRHLLTVPHPTKIHQVDIERPRFIRYTFSMDFQMGYPKSISIQRPSQLLTFLETPIRILQTIVAIPSKLFQLRINLNNDKARMSDSDARLQKMMGQRDLASQQTLQQMQQEIAKLKK